MTKLFPAVLLALGLAAGSMVGVQAAGSTSIKADPPSAALGETVTFTATFTSTSACAGTIKPHYFTIDGKKYFGQLAMSGHSGTETYTIATLSAGAHTVKYYWQTSDAYCIGSASIPYTVSATATPRPSPTPTPSASPSPTPSPVASPTAKPTASPSPIVLVSDNGASVPLGYFGGALLVLTVASGLALALFSRRSS